MQDFHAIKAHVIGQVDAFFDVVQILVLLKLPEGIRGDADAIGNVFFGDESATIVAFIGDDDRSNSSGGSPRENLATSKANTRK